MFASWTAAKCNRFCFTGVGHAEDIFYLFNSSTVYQGFKREDPEFKISQTLVNIMYNFASKRYIME